MDTFVQGVQLATLDSLDNKGPGVNYTDIMATKADHAAELQACLKDIDGAQQRLRALLIGEHGIQQLDQEMVGDIAAAIRAQIVELVGCVHHLENYAIGDMSYTATAEAANSRKPPRKFERIVGADGFVRPTWDWDRWNKKDTEQQVRELHDAGYSFARDHQGDWLLIRHRAPNRAQAVVGRITALESRCKPTTTTKTGCRLEVPGGGLGLQRRVFFRREPGLHSSMSSPAPGLTCFPRIGAHTTTSADSARPLAEYCSLEGVDCSHQFVALFLADLVVSISATTGFALQQLIDERRAEALAADGELPGGP